MEQVDISDESAKYEKVASGVWRLRILFVNVYFVAADDDQWVLIDTGLKGGGHKIEKAAAHLFGENKPPAAIILTHGHFDHIGALPYLLSRWDSPVFAHAMEMPYLTDQAAYPPPDPFAGGGMMSWLSFLYPNKPVDLNGRVSPLDKNGTLPHLQKWRYLHTPGHVPGHISLFRDGDSLLIAGDAFVTTRQESVLSILFQRKQLSGPPKYFTYDWETAAASVKMLQEVNPSVAATGHGKPMHGQELAEGLVKLTKNFDRIAVPTTGRYVSAPAQVNKHGVTALPKASADIQRNRALFVVAAFAAIIGGVAWMQMRKATKNRNMLN